MPQQLNIHEAKTQLSRLIQLTEGGEEFVIARAGRPVAKLVPLDAAKTRRRLGLLNGKIKVPKDFNRPLPDDVIAQFEPSR